MAKRTDWSRHPVRPDLVAEFPANRADRTQAALLAQRPVEPTWPDDVLVQPREWNLRTAESLTDEMTLHPLGPGAEHHP
jgi:hypothetical protein